MDSTLKVFLIFTITVTLAYVGFLGFLIIEANADSIHDESTETISSEASDLLWESTSEVTDPDTEEENGSSLTEVFDSESIESEEITDVYESAAIESETVADVPSDDFVYEFTEEDTYEYDSPLPVFVDEESFFQYMETCYAERKTSIEVIFADDFYPHECPLYDRIDIANFTSTTLTSDGTNRHVLYTLTLYPGTKISDAYLAGGDISMLSSEEVQVYHIASAIVNEAVSRGSVFNAELFIHDAICRATSYFTDEMFDVPRFCTAIGVFLDGQSNCQGYADAFQMLVAMLSKHMDIQVAKLRGDAGGGHVWNLVSFDHGNIWYSVDVCWNDLDNESDSSILSLYKYFNVSADLLSATHSWTDTRYFLNPSLDGNYYYRCDAGDGDTEFGLRFPSAVSAVVYMTDTVIQRGTKKLFLSVPHDAELDTYEEVCEFFNECFTHYNEADTFWYYMYVENLGERSFFGLEIVEGG